MYEAANDRDAVLMIHPTHPVGVEAMRNYWLMPLNGFLFDTTLAASKLVFSGVVKRYPRIRWLLGYLGGPAGRSLALKTRCRNNSISS